MENKNNETLYQSLVRFLSFGFTIAQRKNVQMTKILLAVVLVFLLLNLPRLILGIMEISRYEVCRAWSRSEADRSL